MTITVHESWKGLIVEPGQWFIARWPDGTWCDWDERHTMTHMSDDYERREVTYMNEEGEPEGTIPASWVAVRGKPRMKEFDSAADALAFFEKVTNRDPAHEHDMAKLRNEQLRADISPEEAEESYQRALEDQPD